MEVLFVRTYNRTYTLVDKGDGAFLFCGHPEYCPEPTLGTLKAPLEVGKRMIFQYADPDLHRVRGNIFTTPVQSITKAGD